MPPRPKPDPLFNSHPCSTETVPERSHVLPELLTIPGAVFFFFFFFLSQSLDSSLPCNWACSSPTWVHPHLPSSRSTLIGPSCVPSPMLSAGDRDKQNTCPHGADGSGAGERDLKTNSGCDNMVECQNHCAEARKPDKEEYAI